jgi:dolichyl-phosphate beta-glucosyltransferase
MVNRQVLIGLVIPCYNEENRLDVNTYISFLKQNKNINLLFINDGSNDNTIDVIKTITSKNTNAKTINLKTNVGKGEAVRQGVLQLCKGKYSYIGYWDADLSTSLDEIYDFILNFQNKININSVIGSRIYKLGSDIQRKGIRHILGRVVTSILSFGPLHGIGVYDSQCGAKLFKNEICTLLFATPFKTKWLFDVELLRRLNKIKPANESVCEYPLKKWIHKDGSKIKLLDFYKIIKEIVILFRLKKRVSIDHQI